MSMLGSQIDELRTAAQTERTLGHYELEQMLLDAADTIWELRDDLQRANDAVQDAEHDESMAWDRVRKVEAENTKLRELMLDMLLYYAMPGAPDYKREAGLLWRAHEMGVEVDE